MLGFLRVADPGTGLVYLTYLGLAYGKAPIALAGCMSVRATTFSLSKLPVVLASPAAA